jgi:O-antigen ligase
MRHFFKFVSLTSLLVLPSTILWVNDMGGLVFSLVVLAGFTCIYIDRKDLFPVSATEKKFFISVALLYLTALFVAHYLNTELSTSDRFLGMLFVIPVYVLFKFNPDKREQYLWSGLVLGAVVSFAVGVYQVHILDNFERARGVTHPIIFGDIALIMGLMSVAGTGWFMRKNRVMLLFPVIAVTLGLLASALSMSRGGWVALPVVGLVIFWYLSKHVSLKTVATVALFFVAIVGAIYLVPQSGVQQRVDISVDNLKAYIDSESVDDPVRSSSLGSRLEMWKAAGMLFKESPVVGVGWDRFKESVLPLIEKGIVHESVDDWGHPHNQVLSVLAKGGLLVFTGMAVMFVVSFFYFYRAIQLNTEPEVQRAALAGLILLTGYVCFGFSEAILERSKPVIFFCFYLSVLMSVVLAGLSSVRRL